MGKNDFDAIIYQRSPQMVLGFHGCDKDVAEKIINSHEEHLRESKNSYDWLGNGIYFWLNDPQRAYEWACQAKKRNPTLIKEPYVIGAVIDLGMCLNFCERQAVLLLQKSYDELNAAFEPMGIDHTELRNKNPDEGGFNLIRPLDCAVINHVHNLVEKKGIYYDTVYGFFQEGTDAYEGAGVKEKTHIQICVRNKDCIKGYFLPRKLTE